MHTECTHTFESGHKCHAPATNGRSVCRHHNPNKRANEPRSESEPFILPEFYDARTLLRAVNEVCRALGERRIRRSEAATLLFGLQFAGRLIREINEERPTQFHTSLPAYGAPSAEAAAPTLSESDRRLLKVAAEKGVKEAARQLMEESREPGDNEPISEDEFEQAVEIITVLQATGDRRKVIALMDARIEAYERSLQEAASRNNVVPRQ